MKTWTLRLGLSLMVVVGFWTNPLPAQVIVVPTVPYEPDHRPYYEMPLVPRQLPATPNDLLALPVFGGSRQRRVVDRWFGALNAAEVNRPVTGSKLDRMICADLRASNSRASASRS